MRRVVDLPAPLAPMSVTISPFVHIERDTLQRVDRAVVDVEVLNLQHCLPTPLPRYASMTFWLPWISFGVPRAITSPKSMTVRYSQMPMTTRIWCSMRRIVSLNLSRMKWMSSMSSMISRGFMPAAGSSRSSSLGSQARARAISTRRCSP